MMIFSDGVMKSAPIATTMIEQKKKEKKVEEREIKKKMLCANTKSAQPRFARLFPYKMCSCIDKLYAL